MMARLPRRIGSLKGLLGILLIGAPTLAEAQTTTASAPHVVFVTGDEEYRSEESMPMLARILKRDHGFRVTVLYALDDQGYVDPNRSDNIPGLEALESADLMVMYTRFRALPDHQARHILDYAESGRPMVGFRTATHAFRYENDPAREDLNAAWPERVFGQRWIVHHGHFADGIERLTDVQHIPWRSTHPVLRGVTPFEAYSWLYHVEGGEHELHGDSKPLLMGTALRSSHAERNALDRYPLTNPVAWTKTYTGRSGTPARVFFTTLGHPFDFHEESMRKLALNGILWALGMDDSIPADGARADFVGEYQPNESGFGTKFKPQMRPPAL
jgi:uncharacterized protein